MSKLESIIEGLMDALYGTAGMDWRSALDGEAMEASTTFYERDVEVREVKFLSDGTRHIAPPAPFDAIVSAEVLLEGGQSR